MDLGWDDAAEAQLHGQQLRPAILLRVATDPVIRLWLSVGEIALGAPDGIEGTDGAIYQGFGQLLDMPPLAQLLNGLAERVDFSISAAEISGEMAALASSEAADIRDAIVNVGFLVMDLGWQILSPTLWLWEGVADSLVVERDGTTTPVTRTLKLSAGNVMTGRRRPQSSYWTDPDQRMRSADDAFFDQIRRYTVNSTMVWPR